MRRWVGISLSKYFFWVLVLSFGFGGSAAWAPATAADMTPETQALFQAVRTGNLDVVERNMLAGADINRENDQGKTAVELAIDRSNFKIAHYLLIWRSNLGERRSRRVFQPPQAYYQEAPVQEASPQPVVVAPTPKPVVVMESPPLAPK